MRPDPRRRPSPLLAAWLAAGAATASGAPSAWADPPGVAQPTSAAAEPRAMPIGSWVAFSAGAVGFGVGAIAGSLAIDKHSDLSTLCRGGVCEPARADELANYHNLATISTAGFLVAGAGVAAGVVLLFVDRGRAHPPSSGVRIVPLVGPGSVGALGEF